MFDPGVRCVVDSHFSRQSRQVRDILENPHGRMLFYTVLPPKLVLIGIDLFMNPSTSHESNCIFCQIVAGNADASMVYQDELVTAFMDLYPAVAGHTLVIPNEHSALIAGVDPTALGRMFMVGVQIDQAFRRSDLTCEAVSLYLADGAAAGQVVQHAHLHIVPRFRGDSCGLRIHVGPARQAERGALDADAHKIRALMRADR